MRKKTIIREYLNLGIKAGEDGLGNFLNRNSAFSIKSSQATSLSGAMYTYV